MKEIPLRQAIANNAPNMVISYFTDHFWNLRYEHFKYGRSSNATVPYPDE